MSNTSTLAVGLGSGLALWYFTKRAPAPTSNAAPRNCAVRVEPTGLLADGERVDVAGAVRACACVGGADISVARNASASTYAELMTALGDAGVPVRNARKRRRNRERSTTFTLAIYPEGLRGSGNRVRWFQTETPITWEAARDRLVAAGVIDASAVGPTMAAYWKLTTDPRMFYAARAKPLPDAAHTRRDAARTKRYSREGRRILRDGEPALFLERVDLGNQRYAISPTHADLLAMRIVNLLNRYGE